MIHKHNATRDSVEEMRSPDERKPHFVTVNK